MNNQLEKYIQEILKNGKNSTFINNIEWYCENYDRMTGEFEFKRIDGDWIESFYNDDISIEDFINNKWKCGINKLNLLREIGNWYNCNLIIDNEKIVDTNNSCVFSYESIDEALKDWLSTLEESNETCIEDQIEKLWSNEEIELIKSL